MAESLQVTIPVDAVATVTEEAIGQAVRDACSSVAWRTRVDQALSDGLSAAAWQEIVKEALASVDHRKLVASLAAEIERTMTATVSLCMTEAAAEMVCRLRGISDYQREERAAVRQEVRAHIKRSAA